MIVFHRRRNNKARLHLQDGPTIEGILVAETRRTYVVWCPKVLEEEDATVTVSGHVEIPRERVLFVQVLA